MMTEEQNIRMQMKFAVAELVMKNSLGTTPINVVLAASKRLYKWVSQDDRKADPEVEA